jgi:cullin 1
MAAHFKEHVADAGARIVADREAQASGGGGGAAAAGAEKRGDAVDNPSFVLALFDLHEKARSFVMTEFAGNAKFHKALKEAFESFINKRVEASKFSNADVIAAYANRVQQGTDKLSEEATEKALDSVVQLFAFITDKDVFADA